MKYTLLLLSALALGACDAIEDAAAGIEDAANGARPSEADLSALRASSKCSVVNASSLNSTFDGNITSANCTYSSAFNGPTSTRADYFGIRVEQQETIRITMESSVVDSYLALLNKDARYLKEDDDSAGGTNAQIDYTLGPGVYMIAAAVNRPEERGTYRLKVRRMTQN